MTAFHVPYLQLFIIDTSDPPPLVFTTTYHLALEASTRCSCLLLPAAQVPVRWRGYLTVSTMASDVEAAQTFPEVHPSFLQDPENGLSGCTICAAPLYPPNELSETSASASLTWTSQATLLTDKTLDLTEWMMCGVPRSLLFRERHIEQVDARPLGQTFFRLPNGKDVAGNDDDTHFHAELYIPVHASCTKLVDHFVSVGYEARKPMIGKWSMSKIWDVLRLRVEADDRGNLFGRMQLREPHDYFIPGGQGEAFQWYDEDSLADPISFEAYTALVTSHLQRLPSDDLPADALHFRQRFEALPQELQDRILDETCPLSEAALPCTRLIAPWVWRQRLTSGVMLPFLWDIDKSVIESAATERPDADWERLVRQLAQLNAFQDDGEFGEAPTGLRNRRRIWRVLESMYAGDVGENLDAAHKLSINQTEAD